jgi:hypothetical protein
MFSRRKPFDCPASHFAVPGSTNASEIRDVPSFTSPPPTALRHFRPCPLLHSHEETILTKHVAFLAASNIGGLSVDVVEPVEAERGIHDDPEVYRQFRWRKVFARAVLLFREQGIERGHSSFNSLQRLVREMPSASAALDRLPPRRSSTRSA